MDIAKRVYEVGLAVEQAAAKYDLNPPSVKGYFRLYRAETGLPRMRRKEGHWKDHNVDETKDSSLKEYEAMSR